MTKSKNEFKKRILQDAIILIVFYILCSIVLSLKILITI
ncbi:hypothetical protein SAMN04488114_1566 [Carnobacterium iners]|nr:hypothetical protein SAMN04488114_1566 [Carnobacterium iners]